MNVYQYVGDNPVSNNDPSGGVAAAGNEYGQNHATVGFSHGPNEFDEQDLLENYQNNFNYFSYAESGGNGYAGGGAGADGSDFTGFGGQYGVADLNYDSQYFGNSFGTQNAAEEGANFVEGNLYTPKLTLKIFVGPMTKDGNPDNPNGSQEGLKDFSVSYRVNTFWRQYELNNVKFKLLTGGVLINLDYNIPASNTFVSYNWIQAFQTNQDGYDPNLSYIDGFGIPYYYSANQENNPQVLNQFIAHFHDSPNVPYGSTWTAEVTLVGRHSQGYLTALGTFNYGYTTLGFGYTFDYNLNYSNSPTSTTGRIIDAINIAQEIINTYKY